MDELVGVCHYCGQTAEVSVRYGTQEAADDYATRHCSCKEAQRARELEDQVADAKLRVDMLFAANCESDFGFAAVEDFAIIQAMYDMVEFVAKQKASSVTIALGRYGTAKIGITAKGKITVSRTVTNSYKLEE